MPTTINGTSGVSAIADNTVFSTKIVDGSITATDLNGNQTGNAPIYGIRAWVSFNGQTGVITAAGNVFSATRNSIGYYTIGLPIAMPSYCPVITCSPPYGVRAAGGISLYTSPIGWTEAAPGTSYFQFATTDTAGNLYDPKYINIIIMG